MRVRHVRVRYVCVLALVAACASDSEPETFVLQVTNVADPASYPYNVGFSPGWLRASRNEPLFVEGEPASPALESVAEEGDPIQFASTGDGASIPASYEATYDRSALPPSESWTATFDASPGDTLTFVSMFGASNDTFLALSIDVFADGSLGDITSSARFLDAGTEVNQPVGTGSNQPRSSSGGEPEMGVIGPAPDDVPRIENVVRIELRRAE